MYVCFWTNVYRKGAIRSTTTQDRTNKELVSNLWQRGAKKNNQLVFNNARDHHINVGSNNYEQS